MGCAFEKCYRDSEWGGMVNDEHLRLCASAEWAALVRDDLLPWVLGDDELGEDVLELGSGPGLVTDLLIERAPRVTAVEIDERLATALRVRMSGRSVEVVTADATALPLPGGRFSSAACFTMLHHIPGRDLQDRALAEIARVLRPWRAAPRHRRRGHAIPSGSARRRRLRAYRSEDLR